VWPYASLTAAYALAGNMNAAKAALAEALRAHPKLTIKFMTRLGPPIPNLLDGLRKAGSRRSEAQLEGGLWERVRCSSLVDWPGHPRLRRRLSLIQACG
jgi:hypothetical protein